MTIQVGERVPSVSLTTMADGGPRSFLLAEKCAGKRVVLFAVPGAFTPTCTAQHLPGFVGLLDAFAAKGVDAIVCVSVNDVFVMNAWGDSQQAEGIVMAADSDGAFTRALGLEVDLSDFGLGERSRRYAMIIDDGVISHLNIEPGPGLDTSSAQSMLALI